MNGAIVEQARSLAAAAHEGQVDKAGQPYLTHPARVAGRVAGNATLEAIAWLHDVVEDTPVTLDQLRQQFPEDVVDAVDAITKRPGEDKPAYYDRVAANPLARAVKMADLADNSDPGRLAALDPPTRARLIAKYDLARERLGGGV
ncbi:MULTISPECIES: HD domain-containing protein [Microbacterium]|uniref:HD domain-containing protein n=1 Tax=Microbacterium TaxID=33882 RepID=UPI001D1779CE|nr:HD domain-containing protein [Microbacterium testaceum]MCC4250173.1 HD domain-containing protein [Microbacterium testaceum]